MALDNWDRLVRATLWREQLRNGGTVGSVPYSLLPAIKIDLILEAADEIQDEDPNISRILCVQAYNIAENLHPNSYRRCVLQFKAGLKLISAQNVAKKYGHKIYNDQDNRDLERLWDFYQQYKTRHKVYDIQREEQRLRESAGSSSSNMKELELRSLETKKVFDTISAMCEVMEALSQRKDLAPVGVRKSMMEELIRFKQSYSTFPRVTPYNIIPLEASSLTDAMSLYPEVRGAISAIRYSDKFPRFPTNFEISGPRDVDIFNLLEYVFGFQKDNIRNQRENVVLSIANAQSRVGTPVEDDPKIDERAITEVFLKVLDSYLKWCKYLQIHPVWNSLEAIIWERKLCLVSLYFLIWGEAANVRSLPECICYIFHHMARELDAILDRREVHPAASCNADNNSVSFLDQIIQPIYDTLKVEVGGNNNGKAAHSKWRSYYDFNKYFWSPTCFELGWPMKKESLFLMKPKRRKRIYPMDIPIWHTLLSAILDGVKGAKARLGKSQSIDMVHKRFKSFPEAFAKNLVPFQSKRMPGSGQSFQDPEDSKKTYAALFSPFWNEIIESLREEDYISNREMDLLSMPSNTGSMRLVRWPLFLLSSKILLAVDLALDCKDTQADLWNKIYRDEYIACAVQDCYFSIERILSSLADGEGRLWVDRIFREIHHSILEGSLVTTLDLKKLPLVLERVIALTGILIQNESPQLAKAAAKAVYDLCEVVTNVLLSSDLREQLNTWNILARARHERRLFAKIFWPRDCEFKEEVKRLHLLLTVKEFAANIPKNLEARRRLEFFTNSLFMDMPQAKPVCERMPFCVFTPYYSETVLYSSSELHDENEEGISTIFCLQKTFPDEWENFLERIGCGATGDPELHGSSSDALELRFWASYRGQTLARTVRDMMYYRRALVLQSFLEKRSLGADGYSRENLLTSQGFEQSPLARAQADLKFTYVVSCQIYGQRKQRKDKESADIALLLQRNEALRVAFIHVEENVSADGKVWREFYSKLVKADGFGKDQVAGDITDIDTRLEIYSIKLPGDPKLGEGEPEYQNHAIVFTRGEAVQTIDMNQDNYLEEAMKMRNLLGNFQGNQPSHAPKFAITRSSRVFPPWPGVVYVKPKD